MMYEAHGTENGEGRIFRHETGVHQPTLVCTVWDDPHLVITQRIVQALNDEDGPGPTNDEADEPQDPSGPPLCPAAVAAAYQLSRRFPGATVTLPVVVSVIDEPGVLYAVQEGPSEEAIRGISYYDRRVMAHTLRELADRWDPDSLRGNEVECFGR